MSDDPPVEVCERCGAPPACLPPGRHPLQGLRLLHHRLRQAGGQKRPSGDGEGAAAESAAETGAAAAKTGDAKASTGAGSTAAPKDKGSKKD